MTCAYQYGESLYLNITNQCPCACVFCIRIEHQGVGDGDNLWLEQDPTAQDVIAQLDEMNPENYREVVFCGYGEPFAKLDILLEVCRYLKERYPEIPVRVNTNGLSDLMNGQDAVPLLEGLIDSVSISLNAPTPQRYQEITNPAFGPDSFSAMLDFALRCKEHGLDVRFSVVDVLSQEEIHQCESLAEGMEIPLRVRVKS